MSFKKIADVPDTWECARCRSPEHNPPGMIVLKPGTYEWECPTCHEKQIVVVRPEPTCRAPHDAALGR